MDIVIHCIPMELCCPSGAIYTSFPLTRPHCVVHQVLYIYPFLLPHTTVLPIRCYIYILPSYQTSLCCPSGAIYTSFPLIRPHCVAHQVLYIHPSLLSDPTVLPIRCYIYILPSYQTPLCCPSGAIYTSFPLTRPHCVVHQVLYIHPSLLPHPTVLSIRCYICILPSYLTPLCCPSGAIYTSFPLNRPHCVAHQVPIYIYILPSYQTSLCCPSGAIYTSFPLATHHCVVHQVLYIHPSLLSDLTVLPIRCYIYILPSYQTSLCCPSGAIYTSFPLIRPHCVAHQVLYIHPSLLPDLTVLPIRCYIYILPSYQTSLCCPSGAIYTSFPLTRPHCVVHQVLYIHPSLLSDPTVLPIRCYIYILPSYQTPLCCPSGAIYTSFPLTRPHCVVHQVLYIHPSLLPDPTVLPIRCYIYILPFYQTSLCCPSGAIYTSFPLTRPHCVAHQVLYMHPSLLPDLTVLPIRCYIYILPSCHTPLCCPSGAIYTSFPLNRPHCVVHQVLYIHPSLLPHPTVLSIRCYIYILPSYQTSLCCPSGAIYTSFPLTRPHCVAHQVLYIHPSLLPDLTVLPIRCYIYILPSYQIPLCCPSGAIYTSFPLTTPHCVVNQVLYIHPSLLPDPTVLPIRCYIYILPSYQTSLCCPSGAIYTSFPLTRPHCVVHQVLYIHPSLLPDLTVLPIRCYIYILPSYQTSLCCPSGAIYTSFPLTRPHCVAHQVLYIHPSLLPHPTVLPIRCSIYILPSYQTSLCCPSGAIYTSFPLTRPHCVVHQVLYIHPSLLPDLTVLSIRCYIYILPSYQTSLCCPSVAIYIHPSLLPHPTVLSIRCYIYILPSYQTSLCCPSGATSFPLTRPHCVAHQVLHPSLLPDPTVFPIMCYILPSYQTSLCCPSGAIYTSFPLT